MSRILIKDLNAGEIIDRGWSIVTVIENLRKEKVIIYSVTGKPGFGRTTCNHDYGDREVFFGIYIDTKRIPQSILVGDLI